MNKLTLGGQEVFYEYDEIQDMLYITFAPLGPAYYRDIDELDGVMLRYDGETEELVGVTVHNVKQKMYRQLVEDLCRRIPLPHKECIVALTLHRTHEKDPPHGARREFM